MRIQRERIWALGLSVGAAFLTLLPYLYANQTSYPNVFSGFLINPIDGFSYLAKMREGASGSWYFTLPYAAEPGQGVLLYLYYLFLGQLSSFLRLPLLTTFHAARVIAATVMFYLSYAFYAAILPRKSWAWSAFLITLFGAGLGWMGVFIGVEGSDLSIPESVPLISAYTNAHFPAAAAAILGAALACVRMVENRWTELFTGWFAGTILVIVLPFSLLSIGLALAIWLCSEIYLKRTMLRGNVFSFYKVPGVLGFAGFLVGSLPWVIYNVWLVLNHPVISAWTAQNQTPSPSPLSYLLGYGPLLVFAAAGLLHGFPRHWRGLRLAAVWLVTNILLLYAPFPLQRRLSLGLSFPLIALAVYGMAAFIKPSRIKIVVFIIIMITLPSTVLLTGAGLFGVMQGEQEVVYSPAEMEAYRWIEANLRPDVVVLAASLSGNRIPVFAAVRVLYGHPFETPGAAEMEAVVRRLYSSNASVEERRHELVASGVDYIFEGPQERMLGDIEWEVFAEEIYVSGAYSIYRLYADE